MFGFTLAEAEEGATSDVLAINAPSVNLFLAVSTQWRSSGYGATGLDYSALEAVMNMRRIPEEDRSDFLEDIRIMEDAALSTMREFSK